MQPITETNAFAASVNYMEITDPVLGGTGGETNNPLIALASRTRYLYNYLAGFDGVTELTAAAAINNTHVRKLVYINVTANTAFTLAALNTFLTAQVLTIKVKCPANKCISITPNGSEEIASGDTFQTKIFLHDGEEITLLARSATQWELLNAIGNFDKVGNDAMVRFQPKNTIIAQGQEVSRADYGRLFATIEATAISDAAWFSSGDDYRQFFSLGDNASTFRLPDMRAMHWRGLDYGRGISLARVGVGPGGYEADGNKQHTHSTAIPYVQHTASNSLRGVTDGPGGFPASNSFATNAEGNSEATVKTVGLIPVIYY